jgi:DNA-binding LacI/PurR family transcriptional regulator
MLTDGKPSDRVTRPSIREVAERAGVAMSSVSRVLSGHAPVSEAMRSRVLRAVDELNYEPHFLAQSLRRGATKTVGFSLRARPAAGGVTYSNAPEPARGWLDRVGIQ